MRLSIAAAALACTAAKALESAQWPPPESIVARMKALQETLGAVEATPAQREAAREELSSLLKSPAGQARGRSRDEKPARAAIEPLPSVVRPGAATTPIIVIPPPGGVARLEVIDPPKILLDPRTGAATPRAGGFAIDPRSGSVLHESPGGFIDPKTGRFVPR